MKYTIGSNNFMTLARHATEADIRSIPYAGDAVWRDVKLMRTSLLNKEMLLSKPHIRKILKHSYSYISNMSAFYESMAASNTTDADTDENGFVTKGTVDETIKGTGKDIKGTTTVPYWQHTIDEKVGADTEEMNETDGFAMVEVDEADKTGEIEGIVNALEGLSIQNLRTIKSLIKNVDWQ